jgi:multiple sugar transport system ATP-binding protein
LLQQFGKPVILKERPANLFTGTFVGEPPMNVFEVAVRVAGKKIILNAKDGTALTYDASAFAPGVCAALQKRSTAVLGIRPYAVRRAKNGSAAIVTANQWLGDQTHIAASFAGGSIVLVEHDRASLKTGDTIHIALAPDSLHFFDVKSGMAISHGRELAG